MTLGSDRPTEQSAQLWRPRTSLRKDLVIGLGWGLGLAAMFSAFILLMAVLRGSTIYEKYDGMTTWEVIAYYFSAGAAVFLTASSDDPPVSSLIKWWAVLCLVLAPIYVRITRGWGL